MYFFGFLSTFGKSNLTHLTTDETFSGQRCFCANRLRDFFTHSLIPSFVLEVAWFFCVERLCDFCHSLTQVYFCGVQSFCIIFLEVAWFFCVVRLRDFCVERLREFLWGKVVWCFWVERLRFFSHSLTHEVAWFLLWRGCVFFCVWRGCILLISCMIFFVWRVCVISSLTHSFPHFF